MIIIIKNQHRSMTVPESPADVDFKHTVLCWWRRSNISPGCFAAQQMSTQSFR